MLDIAINPVVADYMERMKYHCIDTYEHVQRVALLSYKISKAMDMDEEASCLLYQCGLIHDIGKLWIPRELLQKEEALTKADWKIIKAHTQMGYDKVAHELPDKMSQVVLLHHERLDGSGYPFQYRGFQIPVFVQLVIVADVFDAMVSKRVYSAPMSKKDALIELATMDERYNSTVVDALNIVLEEENAW